MVHGAGNRLIRASTAPPFKAFLNLQSHPKRVLCEEGEGMQSGQWSLLLVDLIGAGAVVVALAYGIFFRRHIRKSGQLEDLATRTRSRVS